jgi:hypothetical protein
LLAAKARHVLRRGGTLARKQGELVCIVISTAGRRDILGLAKGRRRLV